MGFFKEIDTNRQEDERLSFDFEHIETNREFRRDMAFEEKLIEAVREGDFDTRFKNFATKEEECDSCGGLGYTIEENDHGEYMQGCFDCWVRAIDEEMS